MRRAARRLWLTGRYTDEQIATQLHIPRADTIRDWRREEGWPALAKDISGVIEDEVTARVQAQLGAFKTRYDQLGQVIEGRVVRALSDPTLPLRDLRAIAGTLAQTQKIRDKALGGEAGQKRDNLEGTIAGLFLESSNRIAQRDQKAVLGRCRAGAGDADIEQSEEREPRQTTTSGPDAGSPVTPDQSLPQK